MNPHLAAALAGAAGRGMEPARVDQVWVFPPRQRGEKESGLAVLVLFPPDAEAPGERRVVATLRYEAERDRAARGKDAGRVVRRDALEEQGAAPADRLHRIVEGIVRRLGEEGEAPAVHDVGGDETRWRGVLAGLGGVLDVPYRE